MLQVALQFYPNQANPARPGGRGVYRVVATGPRMYAEPVRVTHFLSTLGAKRMHPSQLVLHTDRTFKAGSRVDPQRIALAEARNRASMPIVEAA